MVRAFHGSGAIRFRSSSGVAEQEPTRELNHLARVAVRHLDRRYPIRAIAPFTTKGLRPSTSRGTDAPTPPHRFVRSAPRRQPERHRQLLAGQGVAKAR